MTSLPEIQTALTVKMDFENKKIKPIKNAATELFGSELQSHLIKRRQGTVWQFTATAKDYEKVFKRIILGLKSQKQVRKLWIKLPNKINGLHYLNPVIKKLTVLKYLSFVFPTNDATNAELCSLRKSLQTCHSLQHLSLYFFSCNNITNVGMKYLRKGLEYLQSLQEISLEFYNYFKITDAEVNTLRQGLQKLSSLRSICLSFESCRLITDAGLNFLSQGFHTFTSLQKIDLTFDCGRITDAGLDALGQGLHHFHSLQDLSLRFDSYHRYWTRIFESRPSDGHFFRKNLFVI